MTNRDIAKVSGLSVATIKRLYALDRWDSVPIKTAFLFSMACGVDLMRLQRMAAVLRKRDPRYLRKIQHPGLRNLLYGKILGVKDGSGG